MRDEESSIMRKKFLDLPRRMLASVFILLTHVLQFAFEDDIQEITQSHLVHSSYLLLC
jgi:hypothetical protein